MGRANFIKFEIEEMPFFLNKLHLLGFLSSRTDALHLFVPMKFVLRCLEEDMKECYSDENPDSRAEKLSRIVRQFDNLQSGAAVVSEYFQDKYADAIFDKLVSFLDGENAAIRERLSNIDTALSAYAEKVNDGTISAKDIKNIKKLLREREQVKRDLEELPSPDVNMLNGVFWLSTYEKCGISISDSSNVSWEENESVNVDQGPTP